MVWVRAAAVIPPSIATRTRRRRCSRRATSCWRPPSAKQSEYLAKALSAREGTVSPHPHPPPPPASSEKYCITEGALGAAHNTFNTCAHISRERCTQSAFPFLCAVVVLHQQQQQTSCLCFRFLSPCSRMSSSIFWSDACRNALNRPLPALLEALYACCGATVRRPPLLPLGACPAHVCVAGCLVCV
jgi:hypothetical protein